MKMPNVNSEMLSKADRDTGSTSLQLKFIKENTA